MIYDTWMQFHYFDIEIKIFDFLPIKSVMNCKEVCSFFTRNRSFTKFYGLLIDNPTQHDYEKLLELFKKRSYVTIDFSVFCYNNEINVQNLMDFIVAECSIERLRMIDLTLCCEMKRLPAFPNIERSFYTEDFDLMIPSSHTCANANCFCCSYMKIYLTGCFQLFTREKYPDLSPRAVTVMFCVTAHYRAYRNLSANRDDMPFLFLHNIPAFPRKLANNCLKHVNEATEEEQDDGGYKVILGKFTFLLTAIMDPVTESLVWKIRAFYKTNRVLSV